jgi:UTP--glucose-1-phosphate uridylyltransferase
MKIQKAVITAAGPDQRSLPLQSLVDRVGTEKRALAIILDEAASAGIEEVCIVVHEGDADVYAQTLQDSDLRITYTEQVNPRGYGHALYCAREFVNQDPFLHLVSDHLYVSHDVQTCAQQLVAIAEQENVAVSAVQPTRESMLPYYGVIGGLREGRSKSLYSVQQVLEKPTPTQAEQSLIIPGLRAGHYLCFYGIHALTPNVMELLAEDVESNSNQKVSLSSALNRLAEQQRYLAFEVKGQRYNIGVKYGLLTAQLALAMNGVDREQVLAQLLELLASRQLQTPNPLGDD